MIGPGASCAIASRIRTVASVGTPADPSVDPGAPAFEGDEPPDPDGPPTAPPPAPSPPPLPDVAPVDPTQPATARAIGTIKWLKPPNDARTGSVCRELQ